MGQIFRRIPNPFMPQGTPDKTNDPSPHYAPGELGTAFYDQNTNKEYLRVELDSGAVASTPAGAVLQGQLAFWKDQVRNLVTNDARFCDLGTAAAVNRVAGIFMLAVSATPGVLGTDGLPIRYMCDLCIRAPSVPVQASGTLVQGSQAIANAAAGAANALSVGAVNTPPPTQTLGVWNSATIVSGLAPMNVYIAFQE